MQLELISVVAKPKGGNRTLRVRIRGRCNLAVSWHFQLSDFRTKNFSFSQSSKIMYFFVPLTLIENCRAYGINTQKAALPKNVIFCHIKPTPGRAGLKNMERRNFVDFLNQSFINVLGL